MFFPPQLKYINLSYDGLDFNFNKLELMKLLMSDLKQDHKIVKNKLLVLVLSLSLEMRLLYNKLLINPTIGDLHPTVPHRLPALLQIAIPFGKQLPIPLELKILQILTDLFRIIKG
jgi:hypothetical protein